MTKDAEIEVLLAEYQASYMNRDHYDSVRWLIGSVFIGTSLATFGFSFLVSDLSAVFVSILFSVLLFTAFILYDQLIQPYVDISLNRCQELEDELQFRVKIAPVLHNEIHRRTSERRLKGKNVTDFLIAATTLMWTFRLSIFWRAGSCVQSFLGVPYNGWVAAGLCSVIVIGLILFLYHRAYPHAIDVKKPINRNAV